MTVAWLWHRARAHLATRGKADLCSRQPGNAGEKVRAVLEGMIAI